MKTIFNCKILNGYRKPGKFYDKDRRHTGVDEDFNYEPYPSPITGKVLKIAKQPEMGNTIYIEDAWGAVWVFAHFTKFDLIEGQKVKRGQSIGTTGNSGTATTYRHVHREIITKEIYNPKLDYPKLRKLYQFSGYNTEPLQYAKDLYKFHGIDWQTGQPTNWFKQVIAKIPLPTWLGVKK